MMINMSTLKATVIGGRAIIEDMGEYPDGTELEVEIVEDDENLKRLDAALQRSWAQAQAGQTRPMEDVIAELRARGR